MKTIHYFYCLLINCNQSAKNGAPEGIYYVIAKFIVNKDGTVTGVTTETNHVYGMEKEVIRVITKGPKWKWKKANH